MNVLPTVLIAALGAAIAVKLRVPAGALVGAVLLVAAGNILWGLAPVPSFVRFLTQVIAGAFLGVSMDKKSVSALKNLIAPSLILIVSFILITVLLGFALYRLTDMNLLTALFAAVPGGITEMSVIADEMGADTATVSVFQIARMTFTLCTFPFLLPRILRAEKATEKPAEKQAEKTDGNKIAPRQWAVFCGTLAAALVSGALGQWLHFPGGVLLFSVIATGFLKIKFGFGYVPKPVKRLAQMLVGAFVGAKITRAVALEIVTLWPYVLGLVLSYLIFSLLVGYLMSKLTKVDAVTAAFSCTPAGSSDMALIASDFNTVTPTIAALQIVRLISVVALYPSLILFLSKTFG